MERANNTMQNFYKKTDKGRSKNTHFRENSAMLEVLSKKIAAQNRQSKTRKGSRINQTYDIRTGTQPPGPSDEDIENEKFSKVWQYIRDKRNRYEQAVYQKLKEQEREMYNNGEFVNERERHNEEIRRLAARRDDNLSDDDSSTAVSFEDYIIGKIIGQGAYAVVRIGLHKPTDKCVAIKIYEKTKLVEPQRRKSVKREIKLMERMNHPNICTLYDVLETSSQLFIIMEFVGGSSLHSYLKSHMNRRLPENEARRIFRQMLSAIKYCHNLCITHRDIKLENILLDDNLNVKIIDFGFSTRIPNDRKVKLF